MSTPQLITVSEFLEDMVSYGDVETKEITIDNIQMFRHTLNHKENVITTITNGPDFHSMIVKHKNNDAIDSYVFYDVNTKIEDLYDVYSDILDMKNYSEGNLCIHEQSDKFQNDYLNDIIERVYIIYRNEPFPDTVPVFFDMDEDMYEVLIEMATERGITLDQLVQETVIAEINRLVQEGKENES